MSGCTWPYGGTVSACPFDADFLVQRKEMPEVCAMDAPMCTYHARMTIDFLVANYGRENVAFSDVMATT